MTCSSFDWRKSVASTNTASLFQEDEKLWIQSMRGLFSIGIESALSSSNALTSSAGGGSLTFSPRRLMFSKYDRNMV